MLTHILQKRIKENPQRIRIATGGPSAVPALIIF
jgi:hypothetical protein